MSYMAIYRLKDADENINRRYMNMESLEHFNLVPSFADYEKIYESDLFRYMDTTSDTLENIFIRFNRDSGLLPADFKYHSMSVGDVVILEDSAWFCDSIGWK